MWRLMLGTALLWGPPADAQEPRATPADAIARGADEVLANRISDGIKLLRNSDPEFRAMGAKELARLRGKAAAAVPDLIPLLGDTRPAGRIGPYEVAPRVREYAASTLFSMGARALPAIREAITNPDKQVRVGATMTLIRFFDEDDPDNLVLDTLRKAAADGDPDVRRIAVNGMGQIGLPAGKALPRLFDLLKSDASTAVRFEAATALASVDPAGEKAIPALIQALKDRDAEVSGAAARSLGAFGDKGKPAISALVVALADPRERSAAVSNHFFVPLPIRCDVVEALGRIGPIAKTALPALRKLIVTDHSPDVRVSAGLAVLRIDPHDQAAMLSLIQTAEAKGKTAVGQHEAIQALSDLGPKARAAVPALIRSLAHQDPWIRASAAKALGEIGDRAAISDLVVASKDREDFVREAAAESLEKLCE